MTTTSAGDEEKIDSPPVPWMHGAAGIMGGATAMAMFYPLDFLRTRVHTQNGTERSKLRSAKQILREEGLRGMYKGVSMAVAAHSVGWGLYLTLFRAGQHAIRDHRGRDSSGGDFAAACVAACCTATAVTPLNLLKTRTQLHDEKGKRPSGVVRGLAHVVKQEGWRSLFRGVGPQILLSMHTTIQVAIYEFLKRRMWGNQDAPVLGVAAASAFSKCIAAVACNPLEVCRTRLQDKRNIGKDVGYGSMSEAFHTIFRSEGVRGLYRGVGINCVRVVPTTVTAFVLYEKCLLLMKWASRPAPHSKLKDMCPS